MSEAKRYRLLKDAVGCSGIIPQWTVVEIESPTHEYYYTLDKYHNPFKKSFVEDSMGIFEPEHRCKYCGGMTFQPDEECWNYPKGNKIIVTINAIDNKHPFYQFMASRPIPEYKMSLIKQAIEYTLNNDPEEVKIGDHTFKFQSIPTDKQYTEEDMACARLAAFNAARILEAEEPVFSMDGWKSKPKFKSAAEYLNSLNQSNKVNNAEQ